MKTTTKQQQVRRLQKILRTIIRYHFSPRWIWNPVAQRKARPKCLPPESERERKANDEICRRWLESKSASAKI
jgi:hypothetical protein